MQSPNQRPRPDHRATPSSRKVGPSRQGRVPPAKVPAFFFKDFPEANEDAER